MQPQSNRFTVKYRRYDPVTGSYPDPPTFVDADNTDIGSSIDNTVMEYKSNGGAGIDRAVTSSFEIRGAFANVVNDWLIVNANGGVNTISIILTDTLCRRNLPTFVVGQNSVDGCADGCDLTVNLAFDDVDRILINARPEFDQNLVNGTYIQDKIFGIPLCKSNSSTAYLVFLIAIAFPPILAILLITPFVTGLAIELLSGCERKTSGYAINDLLDNLAATVGYNHDASSDIVFADNTQNPYYHLLFKSFGGAYNLFWFFIKSSFAVNWNGRDLLDFLKKEYNIDWRFDSSYLAIKNHWLDWRNTPVLDLSNYDPTKICFHWTREQRPAYGDFTITPDSLDSETNHERQYAEITEWNSPPSLMQKDAKKYEFTAATAFRLDGTKVDPISDVERIGSWFLLGAPSGFWQNQNNVLMTDANTQNVRILHRDTTSSQNDTTAIRQAFTPAVDAYYQSIGYEGDTAYNSSPLLGLHSNTWVVNSTIFINQTLHNLGLHNRYEYFADDNPRSARQLRRLLKTADVTIPMCCDTVIDLGGYVLGTPAIDEWLLLLNYKGYVKTLTFDFEKCEVRMTIEIENF